MTKDTDDPRWVIAIRMKESGCKSKEMGVEFGVTPGRARQRYTIKLFAYLNSGKLVRLTIL
jgi:hypothetical protein